MNVLPGRGGQPLPDQRFWQTRGRNGEGRPIEVIGVAKDAKYRTIGEAPRTFVYVPFAQHPQTHVEVFVKHSPGQSVAKDVRAAVSSVEPGLPVVVIQSFDDAVPMGMLPQRLAAWIATIVGSIEIFLAAVGLYGLAAFLVAQRTREIAIRMALGASRRDVQSMVLGRAARLGAVGAVAGVVLASGLGRLVQGTNLLVGVQPGRSDDVWWDGAADERRPVRCELRVRAPRDINRCGGGAASRVTPGVQS